MDSKIVFPYVLWQVCISSLRYVNMVAEQGKIKTKKRQKREEKQAKKKSSATCRHIPYLWTT